MFQKPKILPPPLAELFPFRSRFLTLPDGEYLHYIDEGEGPVLVMVHGNPSWSFMFRQLVSYFRHFYRVIAFDHVGMGLSSRPQDYHYTLKQHIKNATQLLKFLDIKNFSLLAHDSGAAIGIGLAAELDPKLQNIEKLILCNANAFLRDNIAKRVYMMTPYGLGEGLSEWMVRGLNFYNISTKWFGFKKSHHQKIMDGYFYPYQSKRERVGIARFLQDIPMEMNHPSYATLNKIQEKLPLYKGQVLLLWGMKDAINDGTLLNRWVDLFPNAKVATFKKAGHFVLEDEAELARQEIDEFLKSTDISVTQAPSDFSNQWQTIGAKSSDLVENPNRPMGLTH